VDLTDSPKGVIITVFESKLGWTWRLGAISVKDPVDNMVMRLKENPVDKTGFGWAQSRP
jgi:hypothetical protein